MSEATKNEPPGLVPDEGQDDAAVYSKDYWDNVFEQVGRRPLVKFAIALLALLYATAVFAPLIANDRPYRIEAIDYKEYGDFNRNQLSFARGVLELVETTPEAFTAALAEDNKDRTYEDALRDEVAAFENSANGLRVYLPDDAEAPLGSIGNKLEAAVDAALAGDRAGALRVAGEAAKEAQEARDAFRVSKDSDGGLQLEAKTSWPVLESTTAIEIFFMWLWVLVLTWPLWNSIWNRIALKRDRERIRKARRKKLGLVLGSSAIVALFWAVLVGGQTAFHGAEYKTRITNGDIDLASASFAPITMGMSESHSSERFRPPTWIKNSALTDMGHYKFGPRVPEADQFGLLPPGQKVEVLHSEPDVNDASRFLLGTDNIGRDLFVRILYGGRISLMVGIVSTVLLVLIGVVMGALAGYFGGIVDILISRLIEIFQSIPAFFIILTAVAIIPEDKMPPIFAIVVVIALVRWTGVARLVRAEFLRLKDQEFVIAAQALGLSNRRVIFRHVLPNALGPVLVAAAFSIAAGILTESAVSFLGFGVKVPIPSWGSLLSEARGVAEYWWLQIFPGLLIFVTVFSYNIVGEGVRDALDPRRKV
ncbi:MAG: ABC transporter permease [bacterium]|nr:ABC transporter permease [bacterium]